jgi:putative transposase
MVNENQVIVVEDLCVQAIANTRLAKSVRDAGWGMFTRMLEYKAALYGRELIKVDRYFPSTQVCSTCWVVSGPKPLGVRTWTCTHCNTSHDRDINAAKAILAAGLAERQNGCGAEEDLAALSRVRASAQSQVRQPAGDCTEAAIAAAAR